MSPRARWSENCSTGTVDTSSLNMLPSALAQLPDMKEKSIHKIASLRPDTRTKTPLDTCILRSQGVHFLNKAVVFSADTTLPGSEILCFGRHNVNQSS